MVVKRKLLSGEQISLSRAVSEISHFIAYKRRKLFATIKRSFDKIHSKIHSKINSASSLCIMPVIHRWQPSIVWCCNGIMKGIFLDPFKTLKNSLGKTSRIRNFYVLRALNTKKLFAKKNLRRERKSIKIQCKPRPKQTPQTF